jgi:hypothetical protein
MLRDDSFRSYPQRSEFGGWRSPLNHFRVFAGVALEIGYDALLATIRGPLVVRRAEETILNRTAWQFTAAGVFKDPAIWIFIHFIAIENDHRIDFRGSLREAWLR